MTVHTENCEDIALCSLAPALCGLSQRRMIERSESLTLRDPRQICTYYLASPRTMPRRPRPASRRPPARAVQHPKLVKHTTKSQLGRQARQTDEDSEASASVSGAEDLLESEGDEGSSSLGDSLENDESSAAEAEIPDADGARVVQWVDDEEVEEGSEAESESESGASEEESPHTVREQCREILCIVFTV